VKNLLIYITLVVLTFVACKESTEPEEKDLKDPHLILYHPFNGNANDESENGNDGTVVGATLTTDRFGNANSAYSFDGKDDYIYRNYSATSGLHPTDDPFTISVWFRTEAFSPSEQEIVTTHYAGIGDGYNIVIDSFNDSRIRFFLSIDNHDVPIYSTNSVNDGSWHHVVCMWKDDVMYLYVDSELHDLRQAVGNVAYINEARFKIGHCDNADWGPDDIYYFNGSIDDLRIYDRSLSEEEIQELYHEEGWE
jgi:hypothetical protein